MTAPGWYPDPSDPSRQRYFDGSTWTEQYAAFGPPTPPVGGKPGMTKGMKIGLGAGGALLALVALGSLGNSDKTSSSSSKTVTITRYADAPDSSALETTGAPKPTATGPMTTIDKEGTYLVGKDIAPGRYRSAGGVGGDSCYWKRLASLDSNDIIDNEASKGQQVVDILPTDVAFSTNDCQPWEKIG